MEDKNNCPMDPFLETNEDQVEDEEPSDKVNMFAKFSKGS